MNAIFKNIDKTSIKEIKANSEKVLKSKLSEINDRFKNNHYFAFDNKENYRIEFSKRIMKSDESILWVVTIARLEEDKIVEEDSLTISTFLENAKGIVKIAFEAFKAKEKTMKKVKPFEVLLKKALRECNKDNTFVKIPYFSNGISFRDGKYYFNRLVDNGLTKLTLGGGVKKKSDFINNLAKIVKIAERTGTDSIVETMGFYSKSTGFVIK